MIGARVYNRVDRVPMEMRILGWRLGLPTMLASIVGAAMCLGLLSANVYVGVAALVLVFVALAVTVVVLNKADPEKVLSETTVVRLILSGLWGREHDNS